MLKLDIVAVVKDKHSLRLFSQIDFADFEHTENKHNSVVLNLHFPSKIFHSFPPIDRCCKSNGKSSEFDRIDNMQRISCDITKDIFKREYVEKRKPVLLTGCQENWQAKNWTFGNLFSRYVSKWPLTWYHSSEDDCFAGYLDGPTIYHMMKKKVNMKSMTHLPKSLKEQLNQRF